MNCVRVKFLILWSVHLLGTIAVLAQQEKFHVQHFNSENGLPQNSVKGIVSDKEGYLWLATEMGVARYDGKGFRIFDQLNTPVLSTDRIAQIGMIADSSVYFQCNDRKYFLISSNRGVEVFNPDKQTQSWLDSGSIYNVYEVYKNCKEKTARKESPDWIIPDRKTVTRFLINSIAYTHGRYFYYNQDRDIISANPELSSFKKIHITGDLAAAMAKSDRFTTPVSMLLDNDDLYIRYADWIYAVNLNSDQEGTLCSRMLYVGTIPNIDCFKFQRDLNRFYVGTTSDGFYIFQKQFFSTLRVAEDIESNVYYAQAPFGKDGVLTKTGVLYPDHNVLMPIRGVTVESIATLPNGHYLMNIWKDKDESGIAEIDNKLDIVRYIPEKNLEVSCFTRLKNGSIWISGHGYFMGKIVNDKVEYIQQPPEISSDFFVSCFIQTGDNEIWIGGSKGLAYMDTAAKKATVIQGLTGKFIRCLYRDKKGTIWVGTYGGGFYAIYKGKLFRLPNDKNNYLATAHSFMEDQKGFLWITTNLGLFQASLKDLYDYFVLPEFSPYYQYYGQSAGFLTNEFNGGCSPSGIELPDGSFSFPSMKSLVQFHPDSIRPLLPSGPIHLDAVIADKVRLKSHSDSISFTENTNRIEFYISSPYFGNPYNQNIEYKITEIDKTWYPVDDDGIIKINKPPSGNYQLLLRKKSGFGKDKFITNAISFTVQPNFRETYAFKVMWILLFFGLGYIIYRIRVRFLLNQKETLEKEVSERTKEQEYLIENLENTIRELEDSKEESYQNNLFKQKLAIIITHDLQSPLRFQLDAIRRVHKKSLKNDYADLTHTSEVLIKATEEIYHFVEDFGLWLSSMDKDFHVQNETINLDALLAELKQFFSEQLKAKENTLVYATYKPVFVYTDWQLLKIIMRNIIDNANKHTFKGIIEITAEVQNGAGTITIKDNGKGIDENLLSKIDQRLKQKSTDYKERESGYGYRFIIDFSRLLNVRVNIESELGRGTTIRLSNFKMTNG